MDTEHRLHAALACDADAQALFQWLTPAHRDVFVAFVRGQAPEGQQDRIDQVIDILAGRAQLPS
jgi:hypothetical protein